MTAVGSSDAMSSAMFELADAAAHESDMISYLEALSDRCVQLFDIASAGVMLADSSGRLRLVASSDDTAFELELLELQSSQGPCLDAFRTSGSVRWRRSAAPSNWPLFTVAAKRLGYQAFSAVPMRAGGETIGAMNLFGRHDVLLADVDLENAQALADLVTVALLRERELALSRLAAAQLQAALERRAVLEQAKGFVAASLGGDLDGAFRVLRGYAQRHHLRLHEVAAAVVRRELAPGTLVAAAG